MKNINIFQLWQKIICYKNTSIYSIISMLMVCLLSGCGFIFGENGYFRDQSDDYRKAQVVAEIKLPAGVNTTAINDMYAVSEEPILLTPNKKFEVPKPNIIVGENQSKIRAFKSGVRYWVTINAKPSEAWARVRDFWEINSISLALESPSQSLMETAWLSRSKNGQKTQDKFRVQVEHGMHHGSAEIYLKHLSFIVDEGKPQDENINVDWNTVTAGDDVSEAMMQEIASFLIDTEYEGASASLLAQSFSGSPKASVVTDANGHMILKLNLDFDRAWDAIGQAIDSAKIQLDDKDRSTGNYYVNYSLVPPAAKKTGFFSFLKIRKTNPNEQLHHMTINLHDMLEQVVVTVIFDEAKTQSKLSKSLLKSINENLI